MDFISKLFSIVVLVVFYSVYIAKMVLQKKKGIQTDQMKTLGEIIMKVATYSVVLVEVLSIFLVNRRLPVALCAVGLIFCLSGVVIFTLAIVTMRDSWRAGIGSDDKTERKIITTGIYRFSRNPAFLGFDLLYIGLLLINFNFVLLVFTLWAVIMLHLQIIREEKFLPTFFGEAYIEYRQKVRRYL